MQESMHPMQPEGDYSGAPSGIQTPLYQNSYNLPGGGGCPPQKPPKTKRFGFLLGFFTGLFVSLLLSMGCSALLVVAVREGNLPLYGLAGGGNGSADKGPGLDLNTINNKIQYIEAFIQEYFLFEADKTKLEDGIYAGLMSGLEDPYSVYYNEEDYTALNEETDGIYYGIGASVSQDPETKIMRIVRVFPGSPSEQAGLRSEDIIYKVDDMDILGMDSDVVIRKYIRGPVDTRVKITVLRGENNEELDFVLIRKAIEVPTVESRMLTEEIGYVGVTQFDIITSEQFKNALDEMEKRGIHRLVIDLRNNPGGILDVVVDMLDYVLPDGLLVYTADKQGKGSRYYSDDGHELDYQIVVLVNGNSASASEVFAGAIKDFEWGTIMGTRTFGKGIVQNVIPLGDNTAIKITTQHYYTPSGFDLHGKGIEPDVVVEFNEDAVYGEESDNQLQKAIEHLQGN